MKLKSKKTYVILAVAVAATIASYSIITQENKAPSPQLPPPLVRVYTLEISDGRNFQLTGSVHARVESSLGFRVPGKIVKRLVDQGQRVTKGQPLMELDVADLELAQRAAHAVAVAAKAENIRAIRDEERQRSLLKEQAVSNQDYELAKALSDSTTAKLREAEANARQADNQVRYAVLQADADGVIMNVLADVGQVVAAGQGVVNLAQSDTREAVVYLPETMTSYARNANDAFLYSEPTRRFAVKLRELSASADPLTRTYEARYTLEDHGQIASLGSTITVSFFVPHEGDDKKYRVPIGAIYDKGNGSSIWLVDKTTSTVHQKPVSVIDLGEEFADISGELSSGDQVVSLGVHLLKDGKKVRFANADKSGGK